MKLAIDALRDAIMSETVHNTTTTTTTTTAATNVMDYNAAITQLRGHFTISTSKTVAQVNADVC